MLSQISIGRASVINVNNTSNKFVIINLPSSIYGIRLVLSSSVFSRLCRHDFSTLRENLEGLPVSLKFPKNSTKSFLSDVFGPKKKKILCAYRPVLTHMVFFAFRCSNWFLEHGIGSIKELFSRKRRGNLIFC